MDTKEIRCPSGLRGVVRKIKGRDYHRLLTEIPEGNVADQMADLASAIWVETLDPGPYTFRGSKPEFRTDVLVGDRSYTLIQARVLTDGGARPINIECPRCKRWWPDVFDYGAMDLRVWPDESDDPISEGEPGFKAYDARKRFAAGEKCLTIMPDGVEVFWELLTGSLLVGRTREFEGKFGDSYYTDVAARITNASSLDLDRTKPEDRNKAICDFLLDYDDPDFWHLFYDIQDHECGPETSVPKQCPYCRHTFDYLVDTVGFIMPAPPSRSKRSRGGAQAQRT